MLENIGRTDLGLEVAVLAATSTVANKFKKRRSLDPEAATQAYSLATERQLSSIPAGQPEPERNRQSSGSGESCSSSEDISDSALLRAGEELQAAKQIDSYDLFGEGGTSVAVAAEGAAVEVHLRREVHI